MTPLSKKISDSSGVANKAKRDLTLPRWRFGFFICLFAFSFIFLFALSPSPSLAVQNSNGCTAKDDCSDPLFPFCHCDPILGADAQNHCLPDSDGDPGGVCTSAQQCTPDKAGRDCGEDKICIVRKEGNFCTKSETEPVILAAPWFIETPEKYNAGISQDDGQVDFRKSWTLWFSTSMAGFGTALGGGTNSNGTTNTGATGILTGLVLNMTTKPVISSREYLADLGRNLGITPVSPAYAQGIGFNAFSPVLQIWKVFRDIAYMGMVAVFILIGLMVMFRQKIDPRTVVTIQDALPKIIVALILITFSYAIAGFIVDVGELLTRLVANLLYNGQLLGKTAILSGIDAKRQDLLTSDIFKLVNPLRNVDQLVEQIGEIQSAPTQLSIGPINLAQLTVRVAFWLMGFFIMFKIFFALLSPYIAIILSVIFAPIQLLLTALPSSNNAFVGWLKGLVANVLVFPVTFTMLAIAAFLKSGIKMAQCPPPPSLFLGPSAPWCTRDTPITSLWSPTMIGNWGGVIGELAGWGILFTIPKVVEIVQHSLEIKPSPFAGAAGEEIQKGMGRVPVVGGLFQGMTK